MDINKFWKSSKVWLLDSILNVMVHKKEQTCYSCVLCFALLWCFQSVSQTHFVSEIYIGSKVLEFFQESKFSLTKAGIYETQRKKNFFYTIAGS